MINDYLEVNSRSEHVHDASASKMDKKLDWIITNTYLHYN